MKKVGSAVLAFTIASFAPAISHAETNAPSNNAQETAVTMAQANIPVPSAKPVRISFGRAFMASMPQVNCPPIGFADILEEVETYLCNSKDPSKVTMHQLMDQFHANGVTSSVDFAQLKKTYTRFLNNYDPSASVENRLEEAYVTLSNFYHIVNKPENEGKISIHWKDRINGWMHRLNRFQESYYTKDRSHVITDNVYDSLQRLSHSREYNRLQQVLSDNGAYYREDNQQAEAFMKLIKSGRYDNHFAARVNLSVCAGYALLSLSANLDLPRSSPIVQTSLQAIHSMNEATQGKAPQADCAAAYRALRLD